MKFQATNVEYWSQNQVETVFFGNEERGLALLLSSVPGTAGHYLEWNDQSNACTDGVENILLSGDTLQLQLKPEAAERIGEADFWVEFECDEALWQEITRGLQSIFHDKLRIQPTAPRQKTAPEKDYSKIRYLNLEGKNLKEIPGDLAEMTAVETAKLAYNPRLDFYAVFEIFATFPHLKHLSFSTEGDIPENLGKLSGLESLSIDGLIRPCTFPESVGQLKQLKSLLVMSDSDVILPESFAELTELEDLNMRVASWQLPTRFDRLSSLKQLDFSNCRFTRVPPEMAAMPAVETVIFSNAMGQDFAQILPVVARMPQVKVLEMGINPVPKEIGCCKNIEELVIYAGGDADNPIQLPEELFELTQLQTLILKFSYFDKIPEGIGKLKNLKTLVLQESVFENLPESIGELTNLEFLNLAENPALKALPESLAKLTQLRDLYLYDTPQLTELPPGLENLTRLGTVWISNRASLKNIPEGWGSVLQEEG